MCLRAVPDAAAAIPATSTSRLTRQVIVGTPGVHYFLQLCCGGRSGGYGPEAKSRERACCIRPLPLSSPSYAILIMLGHSLSSHPDAVRGRLCRQRAANTACLQSLSFSPVSSLSPCDVFERPMLSFNLRLTKSAFRIYILLDALNTNTYLLALQSVSVRLPLHFYRGSVSYFSMSSPISLQQKSPLVCY